MKILITFLVSFFIFSAAQAQFRTYPLAKDSAVNAQTRYLTWNLTLSNMKGISLVWTKESGFAKGTAVLERRLDTLPTTATSTWVATGSTFTFTNGASEPYIWPITNQDGRDYRIKVVTVDSTQKLYLYGSMIRR